MEQEKGFYTYNYLKKQVLKPYRVKTSLKKADFGGDKESIIYRPYKYLNSKMNKVRSNEEIGLIKNKQELELIKNKEKDISRRVGLEIFKKTLEKDTIFGNFFRILEGKEIIPLKIETTNQQDRIIAKIKKKNSRIKEKKVKCSFCLCDVIEKEGEIPCCFKHKKEMRLEDDEMKRKLYKIGFKFLKNEVEK